MFPTQRSLRILVVDDSAIDLRVVRVALERAGCEVETARDGAEALVRLAEASFDGVVADGIMPLVDGYELCRLVREEPATHTLPVVIYTGDENPVNRLWARICGAHHFVVKSSDPTNLVQIVGALPLRPFTPHPQLQALARPQARTIQTHLARQLKQRLLESALKTAIADLYQHVKEPDTLAWSLVQVLSDLVLPGALYVILPLSTGRRGYLHASRTLPDAVVRDHIDSLGECGRKVTWQRQNVEDLIPPWGLPTDHHCFLLSDPGSFEFGWWGVIMPPAPMRHNLPLLNAADEEFQRVYRTTLLLDQLQEANRRLLAEDQRRTEFVRTISHEIRNPLMAASSALELLEEGLADPGSPRGRKLVTTARRSVRRLVGLASGILDLEKIEAGEFTCPRTPVDILEVCRDIWEEYLPIALERGVDLLLETPAEPLTVLGDGDRIAQCVVNLLSNGIRHSPAGLPLRLAASRQGSRVHIAIVDSGTGVPAHFQPQLFQKFRQADPASRHGTGLGLAITHGLATQMGGEVGFRNNPEGGATFYLDFPLAGGKELDPKSLPS